MRAFARVLYQMPVALPPLVLAFGFILVFSSDTLPWLGSIWLLAAGHVVLTLPYFLQTVVADMQRLGLRTLEDAAESLGSSGWQRFVHIVLPSLRQSILAGLIIVAALSIGEFQFSNLVAGFPQPHLSGRAAAGVLRRDRLRLRGHGDPAGARAGRSGGAARSPRAAPCE